MNHEVRFNPNSDGGHAAFANVSFRQGILSMTVNLSGYGDHGSSFYVVFKSPKEMRRLSETLGDIAERAERAIKACGKNP